MKSLLLMSLATAPLSSHAVPAQPAALAAPALGGNAVVGLCMLSRPAVFARSKVGLAATARLQQLAQQAQAELDAERSPIEADRKSYRQAQAKLSPADRQIREQALAEHLRGVQQKTVLRNREIEATREKALGQIVQLMAPVVADAYRQHACGLLLDRASVMGGNMANDLTESVIKGLDARVTTINFDRETLTPPAISPSAP